MAAGGSCFILSGGDLFKSLLHKISCTVSLVEAVAAAALSVEEPVCRQASALKRSQMNGGDKQETVAVAAGGVF